MQVKWASAWVDGKVVSADDHRVREYLKGQKRAAHDGETWVEFDISDGVGEKLLVVYPFYSFAMRETDESVSP